MYWRRIGGYLEKVIRICTLANYYQYESDASIKNTILIVYDNTAIDAKAKSDDLIKNIIIDLPLAIVLSGKKIDENTHFLSDRLYKNVNKNLINTFSFDNEDLKDLIGIIMYGVKPYPERLAEWEHFSILNIGLESAEEDFKYTLKKLNYF
jgi:GTPase SAR1 family protein